MNLQDKVNLPIKRYEYVVGTWRLLLILEQALAGQKLAELQLINSFGALCSRNHNLHDLSVLGANADIQLSQVCFPFGSTFFHIVGE